MIWGILRLILQRAGDEDDRRGAALAGLQDLVAHRRPAAGALAVERRVLVALLRLIAQHERDLSLQIDSRVVVVVQRRCGDAVSDEGHITGECAGARHSERSPVVVCHCRQAVAGGERDARLHLKRLSIGLAECRLELCRSQLRFDPIGGQVDAVRAQPTAFHAVRRQQTHVALELRGYARPADGGQSTEK